MSATDYFEIIKELQEARGKSVDSRGRTLPASIALLETKLAAASQLSRRQMFYQLYYRECAELDREDLELDMRSREAEEFPHEPVPKASLAQALARDATRLDSAARIAADAVSQSLRAKRFINFALLTQARIAAKAKAYPVVEATLQQLIETANMPRSEDCGLECDFLEGIPNGVVDPVILKRYLMFFDD